MQWVWSLLLPLYDGEEVMLAAKGLKVKERKILDA